jgi:flagellar protein FliS
MATSSTPPGTPETYLRTKVLTATPQDLRMMLLDGAIKFAEQARIGLEEADFEASYAGITRCQSILLELINGLNPEQDPELCDRLSSLYTFMYSHLMDASTKRDPARVAEVVKLLRYERETWAMLISQLADENAAAAGVQETPDAAPLIPTDAPDGLIGGNVSLHG